MKMTVSEYSTQFKTSVQSVYQRIKRGTLKSVEENGIKYVVIEDESIKDDLNLDFKSVLKRAFKTIEHQQSEIKSMRKEIKRLTKELSKAQFHSMATMKGYIDKLENLQLPPSIEESEATEAKIIKPKKSKKKSGKSKKKK